MRKDRGGSVPGAFGLVDSLNATAGGTGSAAGHGGHRGHVVHHLTHRHGLVEIAVDVQPWM